MAIKAQRRKKRNTAERLAAIREKLATTDTGGGQSGFWGPPEGRSTVRIIPEVEDMEWFFQPVGTHHLPDKSKFYCPHFTSEGELDCPMCEIVNTLYAKGEKELAGQLRVRKRYWMNIMVRGSDGSTTGPFVFTPGVTIFNAIVGIIGDPDYGDITDEYVGADIFVKRKGTGLETEYTVLPRRHQTSLTGDKDPDEDEMDRIFETARNLAYVQVGEDEDEDKEIAGTRAVWVKPYDRLLDEYDLSAYKIWQDVDTTDYEEFEDEEFEDEEFEDDEEEEEKEEHEVVQEVSRRRRRRTKSRK